MAKKKKNNKGETVGYKVPPVGQGRKPVDPNLKLPFDFRHPSEINKRFNKYKDLCAIGDEPMTLVGFAIELGCTESELRGGKFPEAYSTPIKKAIEQIYKDLCVRSLKERNPIGYNNMLKALFGSNGWAEKQVSPAIGGFDITVTPLNKGKPTNQLTNQPVKLLS